MSRVAYVNGRYVWHGKATVHVEDRGFQFADGVYEVIAVHGGRLIDVDPHLDRLAFSLSELRIAWPMNRCSLGVLLREVARRNRIMCDGAVYLQVTRGRAARAHAFPSKIRSSMVVTARLLPPVRERALGVPVSVIAIPDLRWLRRDIKSIGLLPNVLGKQEAVEAGAFEAWMVDRDGTITEGTASNAWIVSPDGKLITRQPGNEILNGITRRRVLALAAENGIEVVERPFTLPEAKEASEAFLTSTSSMVRPIAYIDGAVIGNGEVGVITKRLTEFYFRYINQVAEQER